MTAGVQRKQREQASAGLSRARRVPQGQWRGVGDCIGGKYSVTPWDLAHHHSLDLQGCLRRPRVGRILTIGGGLTRAEHGHTRPRPWGECNRGCASGEKLCTVRYETHVPSCGLMWPGMTAMSNGSWMDGGHQRRVDVSRAIGAGDRRLDRPADGPATKRTRRMSRGAMTVIHREGFVATGLVIGANERQAGSGHTPVGGVHSSVMTLIHPRPQARRRAPLRRRACLQKTHHDPDRDSHRDRRGETNVRSDRSCSVAAALGEEQRA
jgi:hypothetical protein